MYEKKVSIIIPTFKRPDTLARAMESCINQDYKNIEIIIVDDNGDDSKYRTITKEMVKPYIEKYGVRYIEHKENMGGALARNTGIKEAQGFFVSFLDDDDEIMPNKISKQVDLYSKLEDKNVGLIYCYCQAVDEEGKHKNYYKNDFQGIPLYEQMLNCIAGTPLWLCPKSALVEVGLFEDTPSKQDTILLLKILAAGYSIYRVPEILVKTYSETKNGKISGFGMNNVRGEINAKLFCRRYYYKLESLNKILNVEYEFTKKLLTLFIFNGLNKEAKIEMKNMIRIKPFAIDTMKGLIKYIFKSIYLKSITLKRKATIK